MAQELQEPLPGERLIDGSWILALMALTKLDSKGGITALAGGTLTSSTPVLVNGLNRISVCATNADSVTLPAAKAGSMIAVRNAGAADATVFSNGSGDFINATAGSTGVTLASGLNAIFFCAQDTFWARVLTA